MEALKKAIDSKDRKAIGDAAKKLGDSAKAAKDESLKKNVPKLTGDISGQAGRLPGGVMSSGNILWSIYIGIAFLILSAIAMAFMGEKVGAFHCGISPWFISSHGFPNSSQATTRSSIMDWNTSCGVWPSVFSSAM